MDFKEKAEIVDWPETHFVYVEKIGPFQETAPAAWQRLHQLIPSILENNKITQYTSQYKIDPKKMVYRAGVATADKPIKLPDGLAYTKFAGGKYVCFVLKGSYAQLPVACGRAFEIFAQKKYSRRDDFCLENYVNNPKSTPEDQLITEILIPTST